MSLACTAPHRPGSPSSAASPSPLRPAPLRSNSRVAQCFESEKKPPGFFSAAPPRLKQRLRRRTALPAPSVPSRSSLTPRLARTSQPPTARRPPSGYPVAPTTPRSTPPTLPGCPPLFPAGAVGLKDPTKPECPLITNFSPPGLAAAGTRRAGCGAAWTILSVRSIDLAVRSVFKSSANCSSHQLNDLNTDWNTSTNAPATPIC